MPSIRRPSRDASSVALALNQLADVAGHLAEEQAHREPGERDCESERGGHGEEESGEGGGRHRG